ncbi:type I restriction enzyme S subunit [Skermanella aerolata]|uniref:restriction endonuclease subunit S n=1 Tax=Skermanella aerolata TaxID=393310 RepID=UPI003D22C344
MSFPCYAEYKDSGVEWLGEVPGHWEVHSLKRRFLIVGGSTPKSDIGTLWDGNIVWVTPADISQISSFLIRDSQRKISAEGLASCGTSLVPAGSILLSIRAPIGSLAIAETELCTNQGCKAILPNVDSSSWFYSYFLSIATGELNIRGKGTTFLELSTDALGAFPVGFPPLFEQSTIAAFLDSETGKIDALVAEQKKLIVLLKEKRQAVISHAVTKGLDMTASMKASDIEWLGQVPDHWSVKRLRFVVYLNPSKVEVRDLGLDSEISFLPMEAIGDDGILDVSRVRLFKEVEVGYTYFREGDVTIAKITPCFENGKGAVMLGLIGSIGFGTTELIVARPRSAEIINSYLHWLFISSPFRKLGEAAMYGAGGQKRVPDDFVRNFATAFPPLAEQSTITAFLDQETSKLDALVTEAQRAIDLLKERRSALISAAVTGKIDVRQFVKQAQPSAELVPA